MPLYEYRCDDCGTEQECFYHIGDAPSSEACDCGTDAVRVFGTARFNFDGGQERWHNTTLKAEQDKAWAGVDRFLARGGDWGGRESFKMGTRAELI